MLFIVDHFWFWKVYYNGWKQQPKKPIKSWGCNTLKGWKSTNSVDLTKENVPGGIVNFMCQMKSIKCAIFSRRKNILIFFNRFVNYINAVIRLKKPWASSRSARPVRGSRGGAGRGPCRELAWVPGLGGQRSGFLGKAPLSLPFFFFFFIFSPSLFFFFGSCKWAFLNAARRKPRGENKPLWNVAESWDASVFYLYFANYLSWRSELIPWDFF